MSGWSEKGPEDPPSMPTEDFDKRVIRTGFFADGKMVSWEVMPPGLIKIVGKGRALKVMCGDIEMVPWTQKLKQSMVTRNWIAV